MNVSSEIGSGRRSAFLGILELGKARKLLAPAIPHGLGEVAAEIAEEGERGRGAPFLAHEEIGICGASSKIAAARAGLAPARLANRSPKARLPTWSWFCRNEMNAVGGREALGSPRFRGLNVVHSPWKAKPSARLRPSFSVSPA